MTVIYRHVKLGFLSTSSVVIPFLLSCFQLIWLKGILIFDTCQISKPLVTGVSILSPVLQAPCYFAP